MKSWITLGCFLTGWNKNILTQCSEASYKTLKKYTASMFILIILWGVIGYCFADRYLKFPILGCCIFSVGSIILIIQVEKQITLMIGTNYKVAVFRFIIALLMAVIGSTIIDQIIFKDDVNKKMVEIRTEQINKLAPIRQQDIQAEITRLSTDIDSLDRINLKINNEIALRPTIMTSQISTTDTPVLQSDGTVKHMKARTVNMSPIENPRIKQVESNEKNLERMHKQLDTYNEKKLNVSAELKKELEAHTGFLEELTALFRVLGDSIIAWIFYIIMFSFLMSLELLIVTGKIWDRKSDYEMIIEYQLKVKERSLKDLAQIDDKKK